MTLKEVVDYLRKRGVSIEFKERSDGSLRIVSIDGIRYKGSEGNNKAREKAGMEMSAAQKEQRRKASKESRESHKKTTPSLSKGEKRTLAKENVKRRDEGLNSIKRKQARASKKLEGDIKGIMKRSRSARRHKAGYAYRKNIETDVDFLKNNWVIWHRTAAGTEAYMHMFPKTTRYLEEALDGRHVISDSALFEARQIRYLFLEGETRSKDGSLTIEQGDEMQLQRLMRSKEDIEGKKENNRKK